jgi:hypothetical protein
MGRIGDKLVKLTPKLCPCGCGKVILDPVCGCQCSSVRPEVAHDLMVRVNAFEDLLAALEMVLLNPTSAGLRKSATRVLDAVKTAQATKPTFEPFPWAKK